MLMLVIAGGIVIAWAFVGLVQLIVEYALDAPARLEREKILKMDQRNREELAEISERNIELQVREKRAWSARNKKKTIEMLDELLALKSKLNKIIEDRFLGHNFSIKTTSHNTLEISTANFLLAQISKRKDGYMIKLKIGITRRFLAPTVEAASQLIDSEFQRISGEILDHLYSDGYHLTLAASGGALRLLV